VTVWFKPIPRNSSPDSVKIISNAFNDSILCVSLYSYEEGEIWYDDFMPEEFKPVHTPNGQSDAFAVRFNFTAEDTPPCYVTKGKIFVTDSTDLEYLGLFSGTNTVPDTNSPYDKVLIPSLSSAPGWIVVNFDTSKTLITNSNPIWLVAKFIPSSIGPLIGVDKTPPINWHSYWSDNMNVWSMTNDIMMRVVLKKPTAIEEKGNIPQNFTVSYLPVRKNISILYTVPYKMSVSIKIYNITGRQVRILENKTLEKGKYEKTMSAATTPSGIYFCHIEAGDFKTTKKLIILK
jgi:hypothetical protein